MNNTLTEEGKLVVASILLLLEVAIQNCEESDTMLKDLQAKKSSLKTLLLQTEV